MSLDEQGDACYSMGTNMHAHPFDSSRKKSAPETESTPLDFENISSRVQAIIAQFNTLRAGSTKDEIQACKKNIKKAIVQFHPDRHDGKQMFVDITKILATLAESVQDISTVSIYQVRITKMWKDVVSQYGTKVSDVAPDSIPISFAEPVPASIPKQPPAQKQKVDLDTIVSEYEGRLNAGEDKNNIILGLAGIGTPKSMLLRYRLWHEGADKQKIKDSLVSIHTKEADEFRERLDGILPLSDVVTKLESLAYVDPQSVCEGLRGIDTPHAMKLRYWLLQNPANAYFVADSLIGVDSDESLRVREQFLQNGMDICFIAKSLARAKTPNSMKFRMKLLDSGATKDSIVESLLGVGTPAAIRMRTDLMKHDGYNFGVHPNVVAESYAGVFSSQALDERKKLVNMGASKESIANGLVKDGSVDAMVMRRWLIENGASKESIAISLVGIDSPEATEWREWLLNNGCSKQAILQGLSGVESADSMELRAKLFIPSTAMYVARSLGGLRNAASEAFRKRFLFDNTLLVMSYTPHRALA